MAILELDCLCNSPSDCINPNCKNSLESYVYSLCIFFSSCLFFLRLPFLGTIPGGLHTDEVGVADFAMRRIF